MNWNGLNGNAKDNYKLTTTKAQADSPGPEG